MQLKSRGRKAPAFSGKESFMDQKVRDCVYVLWDYMNMHMEPEKAEVIVGFGCHNEEIALRCAELYLQGYAPWVLFTGGLGRNTKQMWTEPEARRFAALAAAAGVPEQKILIEDQSTNSGENILFTRKILEGRGIQKILGVHKPFMERRVFAAMGACWPEADFTVPSPQVSPEAYIALSERQGIDEHRVIAILAGDYQRVKVYAEKGYQTPQPYSEQAQKAFEALVDLGYREELIK